MRRIRETILFSLKLFILALSVMATAAVAEASIECYQCHGTKSLVGGDIRPLDDSQGDRNPATGGFLGNHRNHLSEGVNAGSCEICHPGSAVYKSDHRNGVISIGSRLNDSPQKMIYGGFSSSVNSQIFFPQTHTPVPGKCRNVNCHFESSTLTWGSGALGPYACNACHGSPPIDGSHLRKHNDYFGNYTSSCGKCHPNHTIENNPLSHAMNAKQGLKVQFNTFPNSGGGYTGNLAHPNYLPSQKPSRNGICTNIYCHSDGNGGKARIDLSWSDARNSACYTCHKGRVSDNIQSNCESSGGIWKGSSPTVGLCTPYLTMSTAGHYRLVGPQWIRRYSCSHCHSATTDQNGLIKDVTKHVNGSREILLDTKWSILGRPFPTYSSSTKTCYNVYCHSDGTADPDTVKPYRWSQGKTECNSCHGHPKDSCSTSGCHDGKLHGDKFWPVFSKWTAGQEWKSAIPMFPNTGPGTPRANSHPRHTETNFTCDKCHASTIVNGICTDCHRSDIPVGSMGEVAHIDANYHVNKTKDVIFKDGGTYNPVTKSCSNTTCHTGGTDPQWGGSVNSAVICLSCHGTTNADNDDFGFINNGTRALINLTEWRTSGHGRYSTSGRYPVSNNPAANFPGNPCWYCHDNRVIHNDSRNPFRIRRHPQFELRFDKECVYCHMERTDSECVGCHVNQKESLAPQATSNGIVFKLANHSTQTRSLGHSATIECLSCHDSDTGTFPSGAHKGHNVNAGLWTPQQKADVKNQYVMMGVCLQCHDDDSNGKCTSCHTGEQYKIGFDPGTGFIKPKKARATSAHFGYKHYRAFQKSGGWDIDPATGKTKGTWMGGKFCWDCHDPHGDSNIYMIHDKVATTTDGVHGIPKTRASVSFTKKLAIGAGGYARNVAPYNGICNVCHTPDSKHFTSVSGDSHSGGRLCSNCHEHRFSDSHASGQSCSTVECHAAKPIPRHSAFGQPRDCTKCHNGAINLRMNVMGQMNARSHHVQGVTVTNRHCYECHWESTPEGLIDVRYHEGYNHKTYTSVKNAKVDLVIWKPGYRPVFYSSTTAVQFTAANTGTAPDRAEVAKVTNHCISCHSDDNNDTTPFSDCKTPRHYAWDGQSIAARYSQTGTAAWGKVNSTTYPNANKKDQLTKALSAHGNATNNQGGWDTVNGIDSWITNKRAGTTQNVQCFDCHNSHGSNVNGTTASYVTFNGTYNGANLKETQSGKGGYSMSYMATANSDLGSVNPYGPGAGQCFDCHNTPTAGITPWGYSSTFGAEYPIKGYLDMERFGGTGSPVTGRSGIYAFKASKAAAKGGHFKASVQLTYTASRRINGLCSPCHDPHGVSPTLGSSQRYAVPLLKGTWMTSPYKEDAPPPDPYGGTASGYGWGKIYQYWPDKKDNNGQPYGTVPVVNYNIDRTTFGATTRIPETEDKFAGLCLRCHQKQKLTDGTPNNQAWKSVDRIHESVKGWGDTSKVTEHSYTCSKCHAPHVSGLPRLMITNCLDVKHRGGRVAGGTAWSATNAYGNAHGLGNQHRGFPIGNVYGGSSANHDYDQSCHAAATGNAAAWPGNGFWNSVTPW